MSRETMGEIMRDGKLIGRLLKPEGDLVSFVIPDDIEPDGAFVTTFEAEDIEDYAGRRVALVPVEMLPGETL